DTILFKKVPSRVWHKFRSLNMDLTYKVHVEAIRLEKLFEGVFVANGNIVLPNSNPATKVCSRKLLIHYIRNAKPANYYALSVLLADVSVFKEVDLNNPPYLLTVFSQDFLRVALKDLLLIKAQPDLIFLQNNSVFVEIFCYAVFEWKGSAKGH